MKKRYVVINLIVSSILLVGQLGAQTESALSSFMAKNRPEDLMVLQANRHELARHDHDYGHYGHHGYYGGGVNTGIGFGINLGGSNNDDGRYCDDDGDCYYRDDRYYDGDWGYGRRDGVNTGIGFSLGF